MQLPPKSGLVNWLGGRVDTGRRVRLRFEIQWPPRGVPIDPSPQALPDSQFVMLPVLNTLNQPSNPKLIKSTPVAVTPPSTPLGVFRTGTAERNTAHRMAS